MNLNLFSFGSQTPAPKRAGGEPTREVRKMPDKVEIVSLTSEIVNLTPHPIVVFSSTSGEKIAEYPSRGVARVKTYEKQVSEINGVPIVQTEYREVEGLPETPEENTVYLVSLVVAQALQAEKEKWSGHILVPNTAPTPLGAVRDEKGRIIGVRSFVNPF